MILVTEIFHSIQGEGTAVGVPFVFVRLTGCNLRCNYCDSTYAFKGGTRLQLDEVLSRVRSYDCPDVLVTGGEPLMQRGTEELCRKLVESGLRVSIETHGEADIAKFAPLARIIMDIKTPGSGMCRGGFEKNLPHLKASDEIKFVITSREDYTWARDIVRSGRLPVNNILFSPVHGKMELQWMAEQILADRIPVRLQVQLHKIIWGPDRTGV